MDVKKPEAEGWIQWGVHRESSVRADPRRPGVVEITGNDKDGASGVLHWPDIWLTRMPKENARRLGAALIKAANHA